MLGHIFDFLKWTLTVIWGWIDKIDMNRGQWTALFIGVFLFGMFLCCQGYGSRKNY